MADLDDFFAKKDRKKSKTSKKFSTTDEVAKKLEDTAKKTEKLKKERVPEGDEQSAPVHEQDEWKDFEEEKKDYTGLKIGQLNINSKEEGQQGPVETNVEQQSGGEESSLESDRKAGPWKRIDEQQQQQMQQQPVVEEKVEKKPEPAPEPQRAKGAYVPPNLRNPSQQPVVHSQRMTKSKAAPDIHNEEFFPTLSKGGDHKKNRSEGSFEVVQHNRSSSYRQAEQSKITSTQGPKLSLGNRYNTLSNDS